MVVTIDFYCLLSFAANAVDNGFPQPAGFRMLSQGGRPSYGVKPLPGIQVWRSIQRWGPLSWQRSIIALAFLPPGQAVNQHPAVDTRLDCLDGFSQGMGDLEVSETAEDREFEGPPLVGRQFK